MSYKRQNCAVEASIQLDSIYASGAFKNVYKGEYTDGQRKGEECVCKIFKDPGQIERKYFDAELEIVAKAQTIVDKFNTDRIIDKIIWLNEPAIWTFQLSGRLALIEPMITNFEKFNSNTGWIPNAITPWTEVMQALSHYSFHITQGEALFCDLQGGVYRDGFVITDPIVMSNSQQYGPSDLGKAGIASFFFFHNCTKYCKSHWRLPADRKAHFPRQKGSAMILPTRKSRAPLTGRNRFADISE
eukprot:Partr_v1_DN24888_c0_g2_i1_m29793 putative NA